MSYLSRKIALAACAATWSLLQVRPGFAGIAINPGFGSNSANASSWVAGAHAGYSWQQGAAVFGFETDLQATGLKSSMTGGLQYPFPPPSPTDTARTSSQIDWYGTARGILGVSSGPFMVYATGGLAYGQVSIDSFFETLGTSISSRASESKVGWVGGVGAKYLLQPNVILSLQYQYVDLGSLSVAGSSPPAFIVVSQSANQNAHFQAVMAGISWKFTPGTGAIPWTGGYAGVQGGGAWGNNTNASYDSTLFFISDSRLKRDITLLARRADGLGIYAYRYLWSDAVYVGVMAQEVALIRPDAVVRDALDIYLRVDYGRLGMRLMTLPEWNAKNKGASL
jgi:outer membrane immunogenic protein